MHYRITSRAALLALRQPTKMMPRLAASVVGVRRRGISHWAARRTSTPVAVTCRSAARALQVSLARGASRCIVGTAASAAVTAPVAVGTGIGLRGPGAAADRVLLVKKEGDVDFAKLLLPPNAADVGDLKDEVVKKLPSLRDKDPSTFTLHLVEEGVGCSAEALGAALDITATINVALAGRTGNVFLVVKAMGGGAAVQGGGLIYWGHRRRCATMWWA
jgi:hypothetical protein